jgi:hypothetical protein
VNGELGTVNCEKNTALCDLCVSSVASVSKLARFVFVKPIRIERKPLRYAFGQPPARHSTRLRPGESGSYLRPSFGVVSQSTTVSGPASAFHCDAWNGRDGPNTTESGQKVQRSTAPGRVKLLPCLSFSIVCVPPRRWIKPAACLLRSKPEPLCWRASSRKWERDWEPAMSVPAISNWPRSWATTSAIVWAVSCSRGRSPVRVTISADRVRPTPFATLPSGMMGSGNRGSAAGCRSHVKISARCRRHGATKQRVLPAVGLAKN